MVGSQQSCYFFIVYFFCFFILVFLFVYCFFFVYFTVMVNKYYQYTIVLWKTSPWAPSRPGVISAKMTQRLKVEVVVGLVVVVVAMYCSLVLLPELNPSID